MPLCKNNLTMETKTCGVPCITCPHYDARNQKQRIADERERAAKILAFDIQAYAPSSCDECKYFDAGTGGWCSSCKASNKSFTNGITRAEICPLEIIKREERKNGGV